MEKLTNPPEMSTGLSKEISLPDESKSVEDILDRLHRDVLQGESYEDTSTKLESIEALQNFRHETANLPFGSFSEAIETISNVNKLPVSGDERARQIEALGPTILNRVNKFSPRVADLYQALLSDVLNVPYEPHFPITSEKIEELKQVGDQGLSDFDVLFLGDVPWKLKINRIQKSLVGYLSGVRALDRREGTEMDDDIRKWRQEELKKAPVHPPARRNESKPGMHSMERLKEGERVTVLWTIEPGFSATKYFKEQSFSRWDNERNVWVEDNYQYGDIETLPLLEKEDRQRGLVNITMRSQIEAGHWVSCPIPYTHGLNNIKVVGRNYSAQQDQNGDVVVFVEGEGVAEVEVVLAAKPKKHLTSEKPRRPTVPEIPSIFSEETEAKLAEIIKKKRGNVVSALIISAYVQGRIRYRLPENSAEADKYNTLYNTSPKGYAGAVDEVKVAICGPENTYFAALCARLNIPVRYVVGHSVKGREREGASSIHSGTGHAWGEVWNEIRNEWVFIDATSAGDPNLEDERGDGGTLPFEYIGGDDIVQEAMRKSDEQLQELRKKLAEHKEKLSYTREERQLSEGAGVDLKEARQIVKEINEAESTRLPNGELIVDVLARLFNAIVESRKTHGLGYTGPARESEGGEEIEDIVQHYIQAKAGEIDPRSRTLPKTETKEEKLLGGCDLYCIGDKSGSMQSTAEGEHLWQMQRRAAYLIFSSLYSFERNAERAGIQIDNALSVRTQSLSFRGNGPEDIDLDKPISSNFTAQDKVRMWHSLTEQGGGNGDPEALAVVYEQIKVEVEEHKKKGLKDNRLRIIIACSDGGYVGDDGVRMRMLAEELHKLDANVFLVGMGLTEAAANVAVVMANPPYSQGDLARDINDLPALVAKYIVLEAIRLFPEKARESAKYIIDSSIAKFKNI